jgi:hypothetical protein
MHSNGSVTVKSVQGSISVTNGEGSLLASLSTGESITLPSVIASPKSPPKSPMMLAQNEPKWTEGPVEEGFLGISNNTWIWIGVGVGVAALIAGIAIGASGGGDHEAVSICP